MASPITVRPTPTPNCTYEEMTAKKFSQAKKIALDCVDLSRKGSIDDVIFDLVSFINSLDQFFTTSSCSGRTIVVVSLLVCFMIIESSDVSVTLTMYTSFICCFRLQNNITLEQIFCQFRAFLVLLPAWSTFVMDQTCIMSYAHL